MDWFIEQRKMNHGVMDYLLAEWGEERLDGRRRLLAHHSSPRLSSPRQVQSHKLRANRTRIVKMGLYL
jgi:hypothetical protein